MSLPKFPYEQAHANSAIEALQDAIQHIKKGNYDSATFAISEADEQTYHAMQESKNSKETDG
jgi:cellobiose-specific phosphotransferase system component IIA